MEQTNASAANAIFRLGASANDSIPWVVELLQLVKNLLEQGQVKITGLCFGHQLVARALNAQVMKSDQGWEASVCPVDLSARGSGLFGRDKLLRKSRRSISGLCSIHV